MAGDDTAAEDIKGRAKEAVGAVTGQDKVAKEGQAQQKKAGAEEKAQNKEAEAQKARAEADKQEAQQKKNR